MPVESWTVGEILITKVEEVDGAQAPVEFMLQVLPGSRREAIEGIDWLSPTYLDDDKLNSLTHSLLIETSTHKLVVDTGLGNGKQRMVDAFGNLDTDFMERFEQVWQREEVDGVLCTHLHLDHVGWNTSLIDGRWQPTFPNARYYIVKDEFEHWQTFVNDPEAPKAYSEFGYSLVDAVAVFEDSVKPIHDAGLITFVEPDQEIVPGISLISTPGHTPGHVSVLIQDAGETAVITGDLFHSQVQVARPDWWVEMDTDAAAGVRSRTLFLERFADSPSLILGTHFGTPTGNNITRDGNTYKLTPQQG